MWLSWPCYINWSSLGQITRPVYEWNSLYFFLKGKGELICWPMVQLEYFSRKCVMILYERNVQIYTLDICSVYSATNVSETIDGVYWQNDAYTARKKSLFCRSKLNVPKIWHLHYPSKFWAQLYKHWRGYNPALNIKIIFGLYNSILSFRFDRLPSDRCFWNS